MSEDTTLADLLQLNLHKYEDEVRNIVDKAVKESGMEKVPRPRAARVSSGETRRRHACSRLLLRVGLLFPTCDGHLGIYDQKKKKKAIQLLARPCVPARGSVRMSDSPRSPPSGSTPTRDPATSLSPGGR